MRWYCMPQARQRTYRYIAVPVISTFGGFKACPFGHCLGKVSRVSGPLPVDTIHGSRSRAMTEPNTEGRLVDLAEFLRARIAEDEAVAADAATYLRPGEVIDVVLSRTVDGVTTSKRVQLWHPLRALAECDAKRRIVALHQTVIDGPGDWPDACSVCTQWDDYPHRVQQGADPFPCVTLRLLALPYADHPGFRQEWSTE